MDTRLPYSRALRVLACAGCGAPLEVDAAGGTMTCAYCGATNHLAARVSGALSKFGLPASSEAERFARLREQEQRGESIPRSVLSYMRDGRLDPGRFHDARAHWLRVRAEAESLPSFPSSEQLFYLTVLLSPRLEPMAQRAMLETASELLHNTTHRHVLLCMLARLAAGSGDLDAASQWLSVCDPRPMELSMDTAYRLAVATVAAVRQDHDKVIETLGAEEGDVPLLQRDAVVGSLLRIHALERSGREAKAKTSLNALEQRLGEGVLERELAARVLPDLCALSWSALRRELRQLRVFAIEGELADLASSRWETARRTLGPALGFAMVASLLATVFANGSFVPSWQATVLCDATCDDCSTPLRVVEWGGERRTSVTFCADAEGQIAAMHGGNLGRRWRDGDRAVRRYEAPYLGVKGVLFVNAFVLALPLGFGAGLLSERLKHGGTGERRRELLAELDRARRLSAEPPILPPRHVSWS